MQRDLDVIRGGIEEGRRTFANTMKYILTTTSANVGNMLSMAAASLFLPFLPLLAGQILLNNLLSDVPAVGIADDRVDPEMVEKPPRWDIRFIGRFMGAFGVLSSVFDMLTFAVLLWTFRASVDLFRTGWFVESLLTELAVALVMRTRRPFWASRPGRVLFISSVTMIAVALVMPYLPGVSAVGLHPMPARMLLAMLGITVLYVGATEVLKKGFYRRVH
jgi:Mg2+-importing ATPase